MTGFGEKQANVKINAYHRPRLADSILRLTVQGYFENGLVLKFVQANPSKRPCVVYICKKNNNPSPSPG